MNTRRYKASDSEMNKVDDFGNNRTGSETFGSCEDVFGADYNEISETRVRSSSSKAVNETPHDEDITRMNRHGDLVQEIDIFKPKRSLPRSPDRTSGTTKIISKARNKSTSQETLVGITQTRKLSTGGPEKNRSKNTANKTVRVNLEDEEITATTISVLSKSNAEDKNSSNKVNNNKNKTKNKNMDAGGPSMALTNSDSPSVILMKTQSNEVFKVPVTPQNKKMDTKMDQRQVCIDKLNMTCKSSQTAEEPMAPTENTQLKNAQTIKECFLQLIRLIAPNLSPEREKAVQLLMGNILDILTDETIVPQDTESIVTGSDKKRKFNFSPNSDETPGNRGKRVNATSTPIHKVPWTQVVKKGLWVMNDGVTSPKDPRPQDTANGRSSRKHMLKGNVTNRQANNIPPTNTDNNYNNNNRNNNNKQNNNNKRNNINNSNNDTYRQYNNNNNKITNNNRNIKNQNDDSNNEGGNEKRKPTKRPLRNKGEAIIIPLDDLASYTSKVMELRKEMGPEINGIKKVRMTKGGNILLETSGREDNSAIFSKISKKPELFKGAKRLLPTEMLEYREVDPSVTLEEAKKVINEEVDTVLTARNSHTLDIRLRNGPMGTQVLTILAPEEVTAVLKKKNRIKIGLTKVTPRVLPKITRCFSCHGFGHLTSNCKTNPRGLQICRRCSNEGHHYKECNEPYLCRLCANEGAQDNALRHLAGGTRCRVYIRLARKINTQLS